MVEAVTVASLQKQRHKLIKRITKLRESESQLMSCVYAGNSELLQNLLDIRDSILSIDLLINRIDQSMYIRQ